MHIVGHCLASLVLLVSSYEATREWIVLLELIVSSSLIITEHRSDGQILRASVEDNFSRLTLWRAHVDCTEINGIVSTVQWNLELQVILVVNGGVSHLRDELSCVSMGMSLLMRLLVGLNVGDAFNVVRQLNHVGGVLSALLSQSDSSPLDIIVTLSALELPQLRVVHPIRVKENLLSDIWKSWAFNL